MPTSLRRREQDSKENPPHHTRIDPNATESTMPLIKTVLRLAKLKVVILGKEFGAEAPAKESEESDVAVCMLSDPDVSWQPRQARCQSKS